MSIASCRFFSSLVGMHNQQVLNNLVLRTLQTNSASTSSPFKRSASPIANRTTGKKEDTGLEVLFVHSLFISVYSIVLAVVTTFYYEILNYLWFQICTTSFQLQHY